MKFPFSLRRLFVYPPLTISLPVKRRVTFGASAVESRGKEIPVFEAIPMCNWEPTLFRRMSACLTQNSAGTHRRYSCPFLRTSYVGNDGGSSVPTSHKLQPRPVGKPNLM
jgi:hypothetical protein